MSDKRSASLYRRLAFAGESCLFFDRLFSRQPMSSFGKLGKDSLLPLIPNHVAKIGYDLCESLRTTSRVPDIGNVELAMLDSTCRIPQHPAYYSYWYDPSMHSLVGMHVNFDLFRHKGKYYVIEVNFGPYIGQPRRDIYGSDLDPIVAGVVETAREQGFATVVPFAWHWREPYLEEFAAACRDHGLACAPRSCSPGRLWGLTALPRPLPPDTMYFVHNGQAGPLIRYIDDKWYTARWLQNAIDNELPSDSLLAVPATYDRLTLPPEDPGPRWPNLVIKLADSAGSRHVIAARFDSEDEARATLGLTGAMGVPRKLRLGFARSLLFGRDRVIYQAFIPPELDERGCARSIRLHVFLSPLGARLLSGHLQLSKRPIPQRVPRGIIREDDAFVSNRSTLRPIPPEMEEDVERIADHLGPAMQRAIARRFDTGPGGFAH